MPARSPHPEVLCNLVLIGGRGCGKSSIAKRIMRRNRNFMLFSLDALIRYEAGGRSVPEIVDQEGWKGFRELEFQVAEKTARFERGALLDCGGGVVVDLDAQGNEVMSARKIAAIRRHGLVVYLRREPQYLAERIAGDTDRPDLSATQSFYELMERRDPWYREAADAVVECGRATKSDLVERVLGWFYREQRADPRGAGVAETGS